MLKIAQYGHFMSTKFANVFGVKLNEMMYKLILQVGQGHKLDLYGLCARAYAHKRAHRRVHTCKKAHVKKLKLAGFLAKLSTHTYKKSDIIPKNN